MSSVIVSLVCSLRRVESESRIFAHAVRVASMILRTVRFLCILYEEMCVNATPDNIALVNDF